MFADLELIGIPHRYVFSEKGLDQGTLEYKGRRDSASIDIPLADALPFIREKLRTPA
jgi:prolyl-tRNA synthetase